VRIDVALEGGQFGLGPGAPKFGRLELIALALLHEADALVDVADDEDAQGDDAGREPDGRPVGGQARQPQPGHQHGERDGHREGDAGAGLAQDFADGVGVPVVAAALPEEQGAIALPDHGREGDAPGEPGPVAPVGHQESTEQARGVRDDEPEERDADDPGPGVVQLDRRRQLVV
jgi:hypothetical protein